jgi:hypothetical protein
VSRSILGHDSVLALKESVCFHIETRPGQTIQHVVIVNGSSMQRLLPFGRRMNRAVDTTLERNTLYYHFLSWFRFVSYNE